MFEVGEVSSGRCEDFDKAQTRAGDVIMPGGVLLRVSDEEGAADVLNVEGGKAARKSLVFEGIYAREHALEVGVIDFDFGGAEIRDVEKFLAVDFADGRAFVDRTVGTASVGIVDFQNSISGVDAGVPAGDGAILGDKDENGPLSRSEEKVGWTTIENGPGGSS